MTLADRLLDLVVTHIANITADVRSFTLARADRRSLPKFSPGAHIVVTIRAGAKSFRNAYTLTGNPDDALTYTISVLHQPTGKGGSHHLHEQVNVGDHVSVEPPANYFSIDRTAKAHLFIAGGIGITPFVGMARELGRDRKTFELHFAVRSAGQVGLATGLLTSYPARVTVYVGESGQRLSVRDILARRPLGTHVYVCGPPKLVEAVESTARDLGWPLSSVHVERFQYPVGGSAFVLELHSSSKTIRVEEDQSMLEALEKAGIETSSLCRVGACGKCKVAVHACDGRLIHNDHALEAAERNGSTAVIPCVSRFEGRRLVLGV